MSIMPTKPKTVTIVKLSGENSERVIDMKILIANALLEVTLSLILKFLETHWRYVTMVTDNGEIGI